MPLKREGFFDLKIPPEKFLKNMPVGLERENYYETDGALALKRRDQPEKPNLKLVDASGNGEQPPAACKYNLLH